MGKDNKRDSVLDKLDQKAGIYRGNSRSLYGGNAPPGAYPSRAEAEKKIGNLLEGIFAFVLDMTEEVMGVKLQRSRKKQRKGAKSFLPF